MPCDKCGGSGWIVATDNKGYSAAKPCACRNPKKPIKPTSAACVRVAGMILSNATFAPKSDEDLRTVLEAWLLGSVDSAEELQRFMLYALEHMGEWAGIGGLRDLLEGMRKSRAAEIAAAEYDRQIAERKRDMALNPAAYAPLELPAPLVAKPIPVPAIRPEPIDHSGPTLKEREEQLARELAEATIPDDEERQRKAAELEAAVKARLTRAS